MHSRVWTLICIVSHWISSKFQKKDSLRYSKRAFSENFIQHPWHPTLEPSYTQFFGLLALVPQSIKKFGVPEISACDLPSLWVVAASRHRFEPPLASSRCRACPLRFTSPFPSLLPTWIRHGSLFCEDLVAAAGHTMDPSCSTIALTPMERSPPAIRRWGMSFSDHSRRSDVRTPFRLVGHCLRLKVNFLRFVV
jgi:hypothetical protein